MVIRTIYHDEHGYKQSEIGVYRMFPDENTDLRNGLLRKTEITYIKRALGKLPKAQKRLN
jgi:hypothetical protein